MNGFRFSSKTKKKGKFSMKIQNKDEEIRLNINRKAKCSET